MLNIAILGAGRMGRQIQAVATAAPDCNVVAIWTRTPHSAESAETDDLAAAIKQADVAIDFTLPDAFDDVLDAATSSKTPLVSGVSGLSDAQNDDLQQAAELIPLLYDRNMSFGIAVLNRLVEDAAAALHGRYAAEVRETHHVHKLDAPSGTALKLGEALARGQGGEFDSLYHYDPHGSPGAEGQITFKVRREGEVPGDHEVVFASNSEVISLAHSVSDRRVFADGAIAAARWLVNQGPGRYRMSNLLEE